MIFPQLILKKSVKCASAQRYSGRDIQNICKDAVHSMLHRTNPDIFNDIDKLAELSFDELKKRTLKVSAIIMDDFTGAIAKVKTPVTAAKLAEYDDWNKKYGAA